MAATRSRAVLQLRHSVAPRVLDNTQPMSSLVSTDRFSVRVSSDTHSPSPDAPILTAFIWRDHGARVCLAGSFDDWRKHDMTFIPGLSHHILVAELPPGKYFYRFVVDGRWRIAENDPDLREDPFGELSHFLVISPETVAAAKPKRFSTAVVARGDQSVNADKILAEGDSDTESESETSLEDEEEAPLPRMRGDANYIEDYDDDECGELDLQADVFEAMKDVAESNPADAPASQSASSYTDRNTKKANRPRRKVLRKVWAMLFGDTEEENIDPEEERSDNLYPTHNQKKHGLVNQEEGKRGLMVWFPNERNFPAKGKGRKVGPSESKEVIDVGEKAMKLHQVEDNANNRQMLGKTLFAQGKYDAALALFSLSVKLREDNGLKNSKTCAIAHTDVASAFIHLDDFKNAEKHLRMALAIYEKGTFSGGRAQLGDVHCFLGVIGDMKGDLRVAELAYRNAIDLYEKSKATDENPNYATAIDNLNANRQRQKIALHHPPQQKLPEQQMAPPPPPRQEDRQLRSQKPVQPQGLPPPARHTPTVDASVSSSRIEPGAAPMVTRQVPEHVPRPLEPSRPAPPVSPNDREEQTPLLQRSVPPINNDNIPGAPPNRSNRVSKRRSGRPKTWKDLADTARASMPESPPIENIESPEEEEAEPAAGTYEEMSRQWHKDARNFLLKGSYKEAIDLYTLAIYTRKRHGPWRTRENAETIVEFARALFATKELEEAIKMLKDAIAILENLKKKEDQFFLGEIWGNLGCALDRFGNHQREALTAHTTGMVAYGRAGMSTEDSKWLKAWKNLCLNLSMKGHVNKTPDEIWKLIDLQIRGVAPMMKIASNGVAS